MFKHGKLLRDATQDKVFVMENEDTCLFKGSYLTLRYNFNAFEYKLKQEFALLLLFVMFKFSDNN